MKEINRHRLISAFFGAFYGIFGALGFFCLGNLYVMAVFHESHRYPNLYPFCLAFGMISFVFCIVALCGNVYYSCNRKRVNNERRKIWSMSGIAVEIIAAVLFFVICCMAIDMIYSAVAQG